MPSGFFALLDDISALVKTAAASLDDVPTQVAKTSSKVSGIVIDDTAVTPRYVVGLDPSRELSIIYNIGKKSLVNKLLILSPVILLLGYFAPWAIRPILMLGGGYLCLEGYEKVHSLFHKSTVHTSKEDLKQITPQQLEKERVSGAVRTDLILSAEIMAIAYSQLTDQPITNQIVVMLAVAVFITIGVYGFVGLIVKADDLGMHLAEKKRSVVAQKFGRALVKFMPRFLNLLSYVGTVAMLWVGGEIIVEGIGFTAHWLHELMAALAALPVIAWFAKVLACGLFGLIIGFLVEKLVLLAKKGISLVQSTYKLSHNN